MDGFKKIVLGTTTLCALTAGYGIYEACQIGQFRQREEIKPIFALEQKLFDRHISLYDVVDNEAKLEELRAAKKQYGILQETPAGKAYAAEMQKAADRMYSVCGGLLGILGVGALVSLGIGIKEEINNKQKKSSLKNKE